LLRVCFSADRTYSAPPDPPANSGVSPPRDCSTRGQPPPASLRAYFPRNPTGSPLFARTDRLRRRNDAFLSIPLPFREPFALFPRDASGIADFPPRVISRTHVRHKYVPDVGTSLDLPFEDSASRVRGSGIARSFRTLIRTTRTRTRIDVTNSSPPRNGRISGSIYERDIHPENDIKKSKREKRKREKTELARTASTCTHMPAETESRERSSPSLPGGGGVAEGRETSTRVGARGAMRFVCVAVHRVS
jgi:hypothetical protein